MSSSSSALSTTDAANNRESVLTVPDYDTVFPGVSLLDELRSVLSACSTAVGDAGVVHGRALVALVEKHQGLLSAAEDLWPPSPLPPEDAALRAALRARPYVTLRGRLTALAPPLLDEVLRLADALGTPLAETTALYAYASEPRHRRRLEREVPRSLSDGAPLNLGHDVPRAAREAWARERGAAWSAAREAVRERAAAADGAAALRATDALYREGLVGNLVTAVRRSTTRRDGRAAGTTENDAFMATFATAQRQRAAECLLYALYNTQIEAEELVSLIDLIKEMTNRDDAALLDPLTDVPGLEEDASRSSHVGHHSVLARDGASLRTVKTEARWTKELHDTLWANGKPQLFHCVATLLCAAFCAMNADHAYLDRRRAGVNEFGVGNALYPPTGSGPSPTVLAEIHKRLGDSSSDWKRPDVWAALSASYALLLLAGAEGGNAAASLPNVDLPSAARRLIETTAPAALVFLRSCLLPSVRDGDAAAFATQVTADLARRLAVAAAPVGVEEAASAAAALCAADASCAAAFSVDGPFAAVVGDDPASPTWLTAAAAASTTREGAAATHARLSSRSAGRDETEWAFLIRSLRRYAERDAEDGDRASTATAATATAMDEDASYYYGADPRSAAASSTTTATEIAATTGPDENARDAAVLSSILAIIARTAPVSRNHLLDDLRELDALTTLFRLLVARASNDAQGEALVAVAALCEDRPDAATRAWDLLERSRILPTDLGGDAVTAAAPLVGVGARDAASLTTPTPGDAARYKILYHAEQIESREGRYPTTEGLCVLIATLLRTAGAPPDLGAETRRPGAAPYVEYATDFLLPRCASSSSSLPFRSTADRDRTTARALEVALAAVGGYAVPPPTRGGAFPTAEEALAVRRRVEKTARERNLWCPDSDRADPPPADVEAAARDFREEWIRLRDGTTAPRPKSPGFAVMADLLGGGEIFRTIVRVLSSSADDGAAEGAARARAQASALYGPAKPDFGALRRHLSSRARGTTTTTADPPPSDASPLLPLRGDRRASPDDDVAWRDHVVSVSLRLLAAAAVREEAFAAAFRSAPVPSTVVPVCRFSRAPGPAARAVDVSRLAHALASRRERPLRRLVEVVGRASSDDAATAAALCANVARASPADAIAAVLGDGAASAFARRLRAEDDDRAVALDVLTEGVADRGPTLARALLGDDDDDDADDCLNAAAELAADWRRRPERAERCAALATAAVSTGCPRRRAAYAARLRAKGFWRDRVDALLEDDGVARTAWAGDGNAALARACARILRGVAAEARASAVRDDDSLTESLWRGGDDDDDGCWLSRVLLLVPPEGPPEIPGPAPSRETLRAARNDDGTLNLAAVRAAAPDAVPWAGHWNERADRLDAVGTYVAAWSVLARTCAAIGGEAATTPKVLGLIRAALSRADAGAGLPLSTAALSLARRATRPTRNDEEVDDHDVNDDEVAELCAAAADAARRAADDECAATWSASMVALLRWRSDRRTNDSNDDASDDHSLAKYRRVFVAAAVRLSSLSLSRRDAVALVSREGLSAVLEAFRDDDDFALRVWEGRDGERRLTEAVAAIHTDPDVVWQLLAVAAWSRRGPELLVRVGVPAALLDAARREETTTDHHVVAAYGGQPAIAPAPPHLAPRLTLLAALVAARPDDARVAAEAAGFLRARAADLDRLLRSWPRDADVAEKALALAAAVAARRDSPAAATVLDAPGVDLVRRVGELASHLAVHPLPPALTPPSPRPSDDDDDDDAPCWWDVLPAVRGDRPLPAPFPTRRRATAPWSVARRDAAVAAARTLERALDVLAARRARLDPAAVARGAARCAAVARAANARAPDEPGSLADLGPALGRCVERLLAFAATRGDPNVARAVGTIVDAVGADGLGTADGGAFARRMARCATEA